MSLQDERRLVVGPIGGRQAPGRFPGDLLSGIAGRGADGVEIDRPQVDVQSEVAEPLREVMLDRHLAGTAAHAGDGDEFGKLGGQHQPQPMERISRRTETALPSHALGFGP